MPPLPTCPRLWITRRDAAHAYATRTLVNTYLADRRLRRVEEVLTEWAGRWGRAHSPGPFSVCCGLRQ